MRLAIIFAFAAASAHARCNATDPCRCSLTREGPGKEGPGGGVCRRGSGRGGPPRVPRVAGVRPPGPRPGRGRGGARGPG